MPPKRKQPPAGNPLINNDRLKQLYTSMVQCRLLGERASRRPGQDAAVRGTLVSPGSEATAAGVVSHLHPKDTLAPAPGDLLTAFLKGMPLREIALQTTGSSSNGRILPSKSDPAPNLIPATATPDLQISLATGAALAYRNENNSRVVVAFLAGDWQSKPGSRETLSFAAGNELPIVYVSRTTAGRPGAEELDEREVLPNSLAASGMTVIPVDGNDVVAVYRVAQESIHRARLGSGPTLIDARMDFSFGPAGQAKNSAPAVTEPITLLEAYLTAKGLFSATWKRKIELQFSRELDAAWKSARPRKKARLNKFARPK